METLKAHLKVDEVCDQQGISSHEGQFFRIKLRDWTGRKFLLINKENAEKLCEDLAQHLDKIEDQENKFLKGV